MKNDRLTIEYLGYYRLLDNLSATQKTHTKPLMLFVLAAIALTTSTIAGTFGFGGGMLLVLALSFFLPPLAIVPVHAVVQVVSNSSRILLDWRAAYRPFIRQHLVGSIVGVILAFSLFRQLDLTWLPLIIASYILLHIWSDAFSAWLAKFESLYILGALQSGIACFAGAPGPIPMPFLLKYLPDKHQVVVTLAVFTTVGHLLKLGFFVFTGFEFASYGVILLAMCTAAVAGSYIGTWLRYKLNAERFVWIAKALLTALALGSIARVLILQTG